MTRYYHNFKQYNRTFSVLFSISKIILPALLLTASIFVSSCEENPTSIGSGLLPGKDFVTIKSTDTIGVGIYNQYVDSVATNSRTYSYLGKLYDTYFGTTATDFVGQLRLLEKWTGGDSLIIDSTLVSFTIVGAKGTLDSTIHQVKISEIGEMLNSSTSYFSDRDPNVINDLVTFDLPVIGQDTIKYISVEIPNSVAEYLMREPVMLTQEEKDDAKNFQAFFNGVYLSLVDSPKPLVMAFDFSSTDFTIDVVYHTNENSVLKHYYFVISDKSVRYNRYSHILPPALVEIIKNEVKDTLSYLQAFNGVFPVIKISGLSTYKDSMPISVNKAKMIFSVYLDDNVYKTTTVPSQIYLSYTAADSTRYILPDYRVSRGFFDGTFNSTKKTYTFNIASFVQQYLEGKIPKPEVEMYFPEGEYRNVILKSNNSSTPVKFEFTYTKF